MSDSIEERVKKVVIKQLKNQKDISKLKLDSSITDDLGLDSLDSVEMIMALEEEFSCEIPDEEAEKMKTIQDVISYIEKNVQ